MPFAAGVSEIASVPLTPAPTPRSTIRAFLNAGQAGRRLVVVIKIKLNPGFGSPPLSPESVRAVRENGPGQGRPCPFSPAAFPSASWALRSLLSPKRGRPHHLHPHHVRVPFFAQYCTPGEYCSVASADHVLVPHPSMSADHEFTLSSPRVRRRAHGVRSIRHSSISAETLALI